MLSASRACARPQPSRPFAVTTWNVNSLRARLEHLLAWLKEHQPAVVLLQELKLEAHQFPYELLEDLGYNCAVAGQKRYNGVAILSKSPLEDVQIGLNAAQDPQAPPAPADEARYIEALTAHDGQVWRVASVYVPNGKAVEAPQFAYKCAFLARLRERLQRLLPYEERLVVGGDYNVATTPEDVYDAASLEGTVCYHPHEREALRAILHLGYYDAYRAMHPDAVAFSWWDYRGGRFQRDQGLRIDYLLLSPHATDALRGCDIDRKVRGQDKPSDHAPVTASFA